MKRIDEFYEEYKDACPYLMLDLIKMVIKDEITTLEDIFKTINDIADTYGEPPWDENGNFDIVFPGYANIFTDIVHKKGGDFSFTNRLDLMQSSANAMLAFVLILRQRFDERDIK